MNDTKTGDRLANTDENRSEMAAVAVCIGRGYYDTGLTETGQVATTDDPAATATDQLFARFCSHNAYLGGPHQAFAEEQLRDMRDLAAALGPVIGRAAVGEALVRMLAAMDDLCWTSDPYSVGSTFLRQLAKLAPREEN